MNEDTPIAVYDFVLKINHQSRESRVETWETTASRDNRQIFVVLWVVQVKKKICVSAGIVYENEERITWWQHVLSPVVIDH